MRSLLTILVAAAVLSPLPASAIDVSGDQWGTWTRDNSPYNVVGEIRVPPESTLVIEPGVLVDFQGHYKFIVDSLATLLAVGTESDSIFFTCDTLANPDRWHGIRFIYADSNSQISYCRLEHGKTTGSSPDNCGGAIYCYYSSPTISNNTITRNSPTGTAPSAHGGAIFCERSAPTISGNSITQNSAEDGYGGGIYCVFCQDLSIIHNTISDNQTRRGGAIMCIASTNITVSGNVVSGNRSLASGGGIRFGRTSGLISENIVFDNSTEQTGGAGNGAGIYCRNCSTNTIIRYNIIRENRGNSKGGGIYCREAQPIIEYNVISENRTILEGGGISCFRASNPIISNNTISGNSAEQGGGISCDSVSNPTISSNTISDNSAQQGGGIFCDSVSCPTISSNTISGNSAQQGGGIFCYYYSSPTIVNTILWGDTAPNGPEIRAVYSSYPTVTYCDVEGGWPGLGNINCDPEFVNPDSQNYHLQMISCCIDSGDPDPGYNDPDGTRNDIGAFYFRQEPPATIELMPHANCIILPPEGGTINYDAWVYNLSDTNIFVDIWAYAYVPGIGQYGPIHSYDNVSVSPWNDIGQNNLSKSVPPMAPAGEYSFVAYITPHTPYFEVEIIDTSYFTFTKLGTPGGKDLGWLARGDWFEAEEFAFQRQGVVPTDFALRQNYPNPFNAKTTINYQLPVSNHVTLKIYNLLGRRVATLLDETQEAGYRSVIWDASEVSSGLYFYKLTAGDFTESRRMMLVK